MLTRITQLNIKINKKTRKEVTKEGKTENQFNLEEKENYNLIEIYRKEPCGGKFKQLRIEGQGKTRTHLKHFEGEPPFYETKGRTSAN